MNRKWTLEKVKEVFDNRNCVLLSAEYHSTSEKLEYIAQCGHKHKISLENFKTGKGDLCKTCRAKRIGSFRKYDFQYVKSVFENAECKLLSKEYKDANDSKLLYIATCGHENRVTFSKFLAGTGRVCNKCSKSIRYDKSYVEECFLNNGCIPLDEYVNCKTPIRFIAQCGHEHILTFEVFQRGVHKCPDCNNQKRYTYEEVKKYLTDNECTLISKTYANKVPIEYVAQCGHTCKIRFSKFVTGQGRVCPKCAKPRGENHHAYNPNLTDEEREANRDHNEIIMWRNRVYKRDGYACTRCGKDTGRDLNAHHLDGYGWCKEKRYDIENGVTLCKKCHDEFHLIFGYGNNTKEQYVNWIQGNPEVKHTLKGVAHRNA